MKMWTDWNSERGISEEGSNRTGYHRSNRSLQRSYPGSISLEFDADAGIVSDRSSEIGTGRSTTPVDWLANAMAIQNRLMAAQEANQYGEQRDEETRAPSPYENMELSEEKIIERDEMPESPKILDKYADTYELEKYKKNAMIIFNNKDYLGGKHTRLGTMEDETALKTTFEMFNFEVESHLNLEKKVLLQKLRTFCAKDFQEYGCVSVAIMTHGSKSGYLRAYDTRYSEDEIIECFDVQKNPTLFGKPIIILIQACRGGEPATACNPESPILDKDIELDADDHYVLPTESDMVIFHSSYVGRASAREVLNGSWFIQTLCQQIRLLAAFEDFESICRVVRQKVALDKEHKMILNQKPVIAKQMPVLTCTLLRRLYLRKYEGDIDAESTPRKGFDEDCKLFKSMAKAAQEIREAYSYNGKICGCPGYFEYMKKCLKLFIRENPDDEVAISILTIAGNVNAKDDKTEKYYMVNLIRKYLIQNASRFKYSDVVYFEHSRCCQKREDSRERLVKCCSVV